MGWSSSRPGRESPKSRAPKFLSWCALAVVLCSWISCSFVSKGDTLPRPLRSLFVDELDVCVRIHANANRNSAVAVDLLLVYDERVLASLAELTAGDWFDQRDQVRRDFGALYASHEWEWAPATSTAVLSLQVPVHATRTVGAIVFAGYLVPGGHRATITPHDLGQLVAIDLYEDTFELSFASSKTSCPTAPPHGRIGRGDSVRIYPSLGGETP